MSRFAILCPPVAGHLNPMCALGSRLKTRGHHVTLINIPDAESIARAAGLGFHAIGQAEFPPGSVRARQDVLAGMSGWKALRHSLASFRQTAAVILRDAPKAIQDAEIDGLIIDQVTSPGSTVAEYLRLPFVHIACAMPINRCAAVPPCVFGWSYREGASAKLRNQAGNFLLDWTTRPMRQTILKQRRAWGLSRPSHPNELLSGLAQISQLPRPLDFPNPSLPESFHYTAPFQDGTIRTQVDFPWEKLHGGPVVYASMGTLENRTLAVFRHIAIACESQGFQLVLSLGGGLRPESLGPLPGDPIVVHYAPQLELMTRATAVITHGGLNTTLECISNGLPMVVIPVANDQPGVGARVEWQGAGIVVPLRKATPERLRAAIRRVLDIPKYRENARRLQAELNKVNGLERAADLIEAAFRQSRKPLS
ncbi:MAG: hypothetical protein JWO80_6232 [Bryobacterales bacterium]|nr:hypothetical protein [Bryobacterales bacterium]